MKKIIIAANILCSMTFCFAQNKQTEKTDSDTRSFIENAETIRINKDWSTTAEFRSGVGETLQFFPVQLVDLKDNKKRNSLQLDLELKMKGAGIAAGILSVAGGAIANNPIATNTGSQILMAQAASNDGKISVWVDHDQVAEFITFLEQAVLPNLQTKYKEKSSEFIFKADEITFKFLINENRKKLSIILNSAPEYVFWTESRAEKIGDLIPVLKKVYSKELDF